VRRHSTAALAFDAKPCATELETIAHSEGIVLIESPPKISGVTKIAARPGQLKLAGD